MQRQPQQTTQQEQRNRTKVNVTNNDQFRVKVPQHTPLINPIKLNETMNQSKDDMAEKEEIHSDPDFLLGYSKYTLSEVMFVDPIALNYLYYSGHNNAQEKISAFLDVIHERSVYYIKKTSNTKDNGLEFSRNLLLNIEKLKKTLSDIVGDFIVGINEICGGFISSGGCDGFYFLYWYLRQCCSMSLVENDVIISNVLNSEGISGLISEMKIGWSLYMYIDLQRKFQEIEDQNEQQELFDEITRISTSSYIPLLIEKDVGFIVYEHYVNWGTLGVFPVYGNGTLAAVNTIEFFNNIAAKSVKASAVREIGSFLSIHHIFESNYSELYDTSLSIHMSGIIKAVVWSLLCGTSTKFFTEHRLKSESLLKFVYFRAHYIYYEALLPLCDSNSEFETCVDSVLYEFSQIEFDHNTDIIEELYDGITLIDGNMKESLKKQLIEALFGLLGKCEGKHRIDFVELRSQNVLTSEYGAIDIVESAYMYMFIASIRKKLLLLRSVLPQSVETSDVLEKILAMKNTGALFERVDVYYDNERPVSIVYDFMRPTVRIFELNEYSTKYMDEKNTSNAHNVHPVHKIRVDADIKDQGTIALNTGAEEIYIIVYGRDEGTMWELEKASHFNFMEMALIYLSSTDEEKDQALVNMLESVSFVIGELNCNYTPGPGLPGDYNVVSLDWGYYFEKENFSSVMKKIRSPTNDTFADYEIYRSLCVYISSKTYALEKTLNKTYSYIEIYLYIHDDSHVELEKWFENIIFSLNKETLTANNISDMSLRLEYISLCTSFRSLEYSPIEIVDSNMTEQLRTDKKNLKQNLLDKDKIIENHIEVGREIVRVQEQQKEEADLKSEKAERNITSLKIELKNAEESILLLKTENENLRTLTDTNVGTDERYGALKKINEELQIQLANMREELKELNIENKQASVKLIEKELEIINIDESQKTLEKTNEDLKAQLAGAQEELGKSNMEREQINTKLVNSELEIIGADKENTDLIESIKKLETELAKYDKKFEMLQLIKENVSDEFLELKKQMEDMKTREFYHNEITESSTELLLYDEYLDKFTLFVVRLLTVIKNKYTVSAEYGGFSRLVLNRWNAISQELRKRHTLKRETNEEDTTKQDF